ncbi:hypothetical protein FEI13_08230 [Halomonas urmiana]|uniref:Uncharacterized protein n=1 Tax=Halomonas urmiana TaxID=490901 RepID=A0A5R8MKM8_9GAMM|nr:hypothetical protein [Halomonas urmiana]TLF51646.1 hypothetical protein FEI13_08230 [Halomonas urmiana]
MMVNDEEKFKRVDMHSIDALKIGARKGENRFKKYQDKKKEERLSAIKDVLHKAQSLRVEFRSFSHLADFVISEVKLNDENGSNTKSAMSKSSLYRTPEYRYELKKYIDNVGLESEKKSKSEKDLDDFTLDLKIKLIEEENIRLKKYIEKNVKGDLPGNNTPISCIENSSLSEESQYPFESEKAKGLEGDVFIYNSSFFDQLCGLVEVMVEKSEGFYEIKDGIVVTSAYGEEDEVVGSVYIQVPFQDWFKRRYGC